MALRPLLPLDRPVVQVLQFFNPNLLVERVLLMLPYWLEVRGLHLLRERAPEPVFINPRPVRAFQQWEFQFHRHYRAPQEEFRSPRLRRW